VSFEQNRISVGSIIILFRSSRKGKRTGARFSVLEIAGYSKGFALFISGTYFPSYSPKQFSPRSLWIVFFSHWRLIVYWFDALVIFQHPASTFAAWELQYSSTRHHPLPALATRCDILRSSTVIHCHR
jgi:hypothetical protein